jgi:hypothetical protein
VLVVVGTFPFEGPAVLPREIAAQQEQANKQASSTGNSSNTQHQVFPRLSARWKLAAQRVPSKNSPSGVYSMRVRQTDKEGPPSQNPAVSSGLEEALRAGRRSKR